MTDTDPLTTEGKADFTMIYGEPDPGRTSGR